MARHRRSIYALQGLDLINGVAISRLYSKLSRLIAKPPTTLLSNKVDRAITIGGNTMNQIPARTFAQVILSAWQSGLKATGDAPNIPHFGDSVPSQGQRCEMRPNSGE
jgi:hypothetical protein